MAVDPMEEVREDTEEARAATEGARAVMEVDRVEAMAATEDEILYFTAKLTFQEFQFSILTLMFLRYSTVSEL